MRQIHLYYRANDNGIIELLYIGHKQMGTQDSIETKQISWILKQFVVKTMF